MIHPEFFDTIFAARHAALAAGVAVQP